MAYPHTLGNSLRMYDQAIYTWLDNLKVDYGDIAGTPRRAFGILRVLSTPRRAFSRMEDILVRKGWLNPADPGSGSGTSEETRKSYQRIPLPFVSVYMQPPQVDPSRASVSFIRGILPSVENLTSQQHPYPLPINIPVQLDFWMKKKFTDIYIKEWIYSNLNVLGTYPNEFMLTVTPVDSNSQNPWGNKLVPITIESVDDASDLEPGEGDRLLRTSVTLTMAAWLFMPPGGPGARGGSGDDLGTMHHVKQFNITTCRKQKLGDPEIEYSDILYYRFSLIYIEGWEVKETDDDFVFETEDETILYEPGANVLEYLGSNNFPVDPVDYTITAKIKGKGTLTVTILDDIGATITTEVYTLGVTTDKLEWEFTALDENVYEVRITVTEQVIISQFDLKKKLV